LQSGSANQGKKLKKPLASCLINLDYVEGTLGKLFSYRNVTELSSRVRFKV